MTSVPGLIGHALGSPGKRCPVHHLVTEQSSNREQTPHQKTLDMQSSHHGLRRICITNTSHRDPHTHHHSHLRAIKDLRAASHVSSLWKGIHANSTQTCEMAAGPSSLVTPYPHQGLRRRANRNIPKQLARGIICSIESERDRLAITCRLFYDSMNQERERGVVF